MNAVSRWTPTVRKIAQSQRPTYGSLLVYWTVYGGVPPVMAGSRTNPPGRSRAEGVRFSDATIAVAFGQNPVVAPPTSSRIRFDPPPFWGFAASCTATVTQYPPATPYLWVELALV